MILRRLVFTFLTLTASASGAAGDSYRVRTTYGWVQGKEQTSRGGRKYGSYEGIPYGKVRQRFSYPDEPENWDDVYDATYIRYRCPQFDLTTYEFIDTSDDCLFLNIYVPKHAGKARLFPILFWIHGGGFLFGSGYDMEPSYWMDKDVIVVTFNYRLGVFGFLNLGNSEIPGNMGIHDCKLALKWVRENAVQFGGNSSNITPMGESAGGALVHTLMISPLFECFSRMIIQSGSMLDPWAFTKDPMVVNQLFLAYIGCNKPSMPDTMACLLNKTTMDMLKAQLFSTGRAFPFTPTLDAHAGANSAFPKTPFELIEDGHCNDKTHFIIGCNQVEAIGWAVDVLRYPGYIDYMNENWTPAIANLLFLYDKFPDQNVTELTLKMKQLYLQGNNLTRDSLQPFTVLISDYLFVWGCGQTAILHAGKGAKVYLYIYKFWTSYSSVETTSLGFPYSGPAHSDELQFLWVNRYGAWPVYIEPSRERDFSVAFVNLWYSFIAFGNGNNTFPLEHAHYDCRHPNAWTLAWNPIGCHDSDRSNEANSMLTWYVIDDPPRLEMQNHTQLEAMHFWSEAFAGHSFS